MGIRIWNSMNRWIIADHLNLNSWIHSSLHNFITSQFSHIFSTDFRARLTEPWTVEPHEAARRWFCHPTAMAAGPRENQGYELMGFYSSICLGIAHSRNIQRPDGEDVPSFESWSPNFVWSHEGPSLSHRYGCSIFIHEPEIRLKTLYT